MLDVDACRDGDEKGEERREDRERGAERVSEGLRQPGRVDEAVFVRFLEEGEGCARVRGACAEEDEERVVAVFAFVREPEDGRERGGGHVHAAVDPRMHDLEKQPGAEIRPRAWSSEHAIHRADRCVRVRF